MLKPDLSTIKEMSAQYNTIPVSKYFLADIITPITLLRKISGISSRYFLLESVEGGEKWGRYSFIGFDPVMRLTCKNSVVTIESENNTETLRTSDPLDEVRKKPYERVAVFAHGGVLVSAQAYAGLVKFEEAFSALTPYGGVIELELND